MPREPARLALADSHDMIQVRGARENNLADVSLTAQHLRAYLKGA